MNSFENILPNFSLKPNIPKFGLIIICTSLLFSNLLAQDNVIGDNDNTQIEASNYSKNKYSLGLNTHFGLQMLVDADTKTNADFILRNHISDNKALRFGFNYLFSSTDLSIGNGRSINTEHSYEIGVYLGFEWQKPMNARWQWYYGIDFGRSIQIKDWKEEVYHGWHQVKESRIDSSTRSFDMLPFLGFKYDITSYLFLTSEMKIAGKYGLTEDKLYIADALTATRSLEESTSNRIGVNFRPYTGIFLHYIF